mmetsp:Transcript_14689/g.21944  ORF Transcript_14689/g.21944 Transcript_14689/m.21944 type:complete len:219 (-) Transcript_14689:359-1015(-)
MIQYSTLKFLHPPHPQQLEKANGKILRKKSLVYEKPKRKKPKSHLNPLLLLLHLFLSLQTHIIWHKHLLPRFPLPMPFGLLWYHISLILPKKTFSTCCPTISMVRILSGSYLHLVTILRLLPTPKHTMKPVQEPVLLHLPSHKKSLKVVVILLNVSLLRLLKKKCCPKVQHQFVHQVLVIQQLHPHLLPAMHHPQQRDYHRSMIFQLIRRPLQNTLQK